MAKCENLSSRVNRLLATSNNGKGQNTKNTKIIRSRPVNESATPDFGFRIEISEKNNK